MNHRRSIPLLAASLLAGASLLLAQVQTLPAPAGPAVQPAAPVGPDGALAGKESSQGVYVRDSAIAVDKFALAERMTKLKEWNKAADALQEVIEKHADRVMPSQVDAKNVIYQYTSVTTAVQERLAKWPQEGLDVYRARFEPQAAALLEQAGPDDVAALHRAYALYFVTDTGKAAGLRLIDLYLESGEFPAAAWLAERMLAWHPMLDAERPKLIYRAALAYHLSGDANGAAAKLEGLKTKFAGAKATIRGQEVALAESLARELETAPPVARGASGDSWPMFGGSPDRGRVPEAGGSLGALINFTEYVRGPRLRTSVPTDRQDADRNERRLRDEGLTLGVFPAVDRGEMFFQDNARVYGVSVETGVVLPGWAATYGDRGGRYVASTKAPPLPRNHHFTVTVTDNAVLAVTGQLDPTTFVNQGIPAPADRETRLVCLDRTSGQERWSITPRQLPDAAAALRTLSMSGSPLVVGDNVYILGRGGKPMQFEDTYVLCFALRDGSYRWSCYLASGNVDPNNMPGMMGGAMENVSHLAYASGRLYALTNLGALAAVDAYSGTIVWLNIYPRPKPDFAEFRGRWNRAENLGAPAKPWHHNPVIVKDGRVFILPDDAQHLLVYDAGSGVEIKRIRTSDFENAKTMLAVAGERLILCSDRSVFCVNWPAYNPQSDRNANLFWFAPFLKQGFNKDSIRGRGFVTSDSVFISTAWALFRLSLKSGRIEKSYPRDRVWDAGEGPGNVLVTEDHVVLATADRVNVYTDLAVARERLDAGVAAAPNDPEPRLRYAEMMFVSNQLDVALAKLDEAMALLGHGGGGGGTMKPGPARDRVFSIALTFAQKLADPEANKPDERKLAEALFDRAGAAAHSPAQQVNYRMTRARYADPAGRVRLYQEVLASDELRDVSYAADERGTMAAAAVAENAIREIIGTVGRDVYAPFDAQASEALAAAKAKDDPDALQAVARSFPNAKVAPDAMLAAADAYEAAGKHRRATQVLNQVYQHYRSTIDPARIIESQVRNYLKLPGGVGTAIGRLAAAPKGSRLSKPLTMPDGSTVGDVPLADVAAALHRFTAQEVAGMLPNFGLPPDPAVRGPDGKRIKALVEQPEAAIADVTMLVVPRREFARHDRIITWTENRGLAIYPVGQTNPVGSHVAFADTPRGAAWVDDDRVLVWGATRAMLLSGKGGAQLWETTVKGLGELELSAPGETIVDAPPAGANDAEQIMIEQRALNLRLRAQRGMVVGGGGNAVVVVNAQGEVVQPQQPQQPQGPGEQIDHVRPTGERAILCTTTGRIAALELATGKPAWQVRVAEGPVAQLVANDDFTVARFTDATAAQIAVFNTFTGQPAGPRRVFPLQNARQPINMALSPDGTLVWTTVAQLCGKYLFEPDRELSFRVPEPATSPLYMNASQPDQLVIANGQILVVTDNGQNVRVHSLEDGKAVTTNPNPLFTGAQSPAVTLRPLGSRLYVINAKGAVSYNLDRTDDKWGLPPINMQPTPAVREAMIGQDYLVLLDQLSGPVPNANPAAAAAAAAAAAGAGRQAYRLLAHSRAQIKREGQGQGDGANLVESGRLDYEQTVTSPAGISSEWQGVNGGFYYRTLDRTVRFLRGARP